MKRVFLTSMGKFISLLLVYNIFLSVASNLSYYAIDTQDSSIDKFDVQLELDYHQGQYSKENTIAFSFNTLPDLFLAYYLPETFFPFKQLIGNLFLQQTKYVNAYSRNIFYTFISASAP